MSASRLSRKTQSRRRRQLILTLSGLTLAAFLLFQFGLWAITGISSFFIWFNERGSDQTSRRNLQEILSPPILEALPPGTDKDTIMIKGRSPQDYGSIEIYVNNDLYKEILIAKKEFEAEIKNLKEGENIIEARFLSEDDKKSPFSKPITITYSKEPPKLEIDYPSDGTTFRRGDEVIEIRGKTDPDNKVKINDFRAIVDEQGNFSYNFRLSEGDNLITIEAENKAAIKTSKQIKIIFSP